MSYALVEDVPSSWEQYGAMARSVGQAPPGLLLHVAGPTDEVIRIIETWESEAAWLRVAAERDAARDSVDPVVAARTVVRYLRAIHVVVGEPGKGAEERESPVDGDLDAGRSGCRPASRERRIGHLQAPDQVTHPTSADGFAGAHVPEGG